MTIRSEIHRHAGYVAHHVSGTLQLEDIRATWQLLLESQQYNPSLNVIWNFEPGAVVSISSEGMHGLVKRLSVHAEKRGGDYRLAFVSGDDLNFGVSRMFEGLAVRLPMTINVFRSLEDAIEWVTVTR